MKVYFAHPHRDKDTADKKRIMGLLEDKFTEVVDPFLKKSESTGDGWLIWSDDLKLIDECDIVFAWIPDREVIGIIAELEYSKKTKKQIIYTAIKSAFFEHLEKEFGAKFIYYG